MLRPTQEHGAEKLVNVVLRKSLAEIAEIVSGFGFPKHLQGKTEGELPFFKVGDISRVWSRGEKLLTNAEHYLARKEAEQIKAKVFPKGTVVFAKIGEAIKLNRRAILGQPSIVDNNVMGLIPRQGLVDTLYLYYHMLTVKLGDISQATTVPSVRKSDVESIAFPLVPIEAQTRIVAEIEKQFSRLDEAVANLKRVKANLKRYKAAVLKAAVEGALVPIKNRQTTKIGEVAELVTKGSSPNWQGFTYADRGVVFVRSQNVGWGNLDLSDVAHLPPAFNEKERKSVLRTGDVLLNIVGASIGRAAVATPEIEGGNVNQAVAVIRLNKERMLPKYLMLNLLSPGTQAAIHTEKVDVARANVSLSDIKAFSILCPSLAEQSMMVAEVELRLSVIEELQAAVEADLTRADRLRQSLLARAFRGELCIEAKGAKCP